jgi:hypothetical protein
MPYAHIKQFVPYAASTPFQNGFAQSHASFNLGASRNYRKLGTAPPDLPGCCCGMME